MAKKINVKREAQRQNVAQYLDYAAKTDVHVKPTKGINSGAHGNAFERAVKLELGNYRFKGTAKRGHYDSTKKIDGNRYRIEIKQGAGELATLDENGNIIHSELTADLFIYAPEYDPNFDVIYQAYVLTTDNFIACIKAARLTRLKKSTAQYRRPEDERYYDRLAIQTFTNSKKAMERLYNALEEYGQPLNKWLVENKIK